MSLSELLAQDWRGACAVVRGARDLAVTSAVAASRDAPLAPESLSSSEPFGAKACVTSSQKDMMSPLIATRSAPKPPPTQRQRPEASWQQVHQKQVRRVGELRAHLEQNQQRRSRSRAPFLCKSALSRGGTDRFLLLRN